MRASVLRRLREMPLVLLVSDDNPDVDADKWRQQGVAGFMTKSMSKGEMVECLENVLSTPYQVSQPESRNESQNEPQDEAHEEAHEEAHKETRVNRMASPTPLLDTEAFITAVASLPHEISSAESLCVLVFGIDRLSELISRFGSDVPDLLTGRIAKLLAAKIDPRDVLGRCGEDRVAIVSHGVDLRAGVDFGKRVCKSMATGQIAVHGRKAQLTTSVGVAATSDDHVASPEELLALAEMRLKQAMICGGNSVCTESRPNCPLSQRDKDFLALFQLLGEVLESEQKETLGMAIQPLLRKLDAKLSIDVKLALNLPLDDAENPAHDSVQTGKGKKAS
jgi:diguanylate cyclase (GGDEF)-like protein